MGTARAGVSEGDAGAVCTLELGVTAGAVDHRDDCREESDEEHGGEGEGREHSEERVRACPMVPLPYLTVSSGVWSHSQADLQKHHNCLTQGLVLHWGCLGVLWELWLGLSGYLMATNAFSDRRGWLHCIITANTAQGCTTNFCSQQVQNWLLQLGGLFNPHVFVS